MKPDVNNPGPIEATSKPALKEEERVLPTPEQAIDRVGEQPIASTGQSTTSQPSTTTPVSTTVVPAKPASQAVVQGTAKDQFVAQLAQLPAEDNDVIEKVWVEKADEIVDKTQDDPYLEDEAQHSLSRAYLKKRFNLDVD